VRLATAVTYEINAYPQPKLGKPYATVPIEATLLQEDGCPTWILPTVIRQFQHLMDSTPGRPVQLSTNPADWDDQPRDSAPTDRILTPRRNAIIPPARSEPW
jgi:hypothetical protein